MPFLPAFEARGSSTPARGRRLLIPIAAAVLAVGSASVSALPATADGGEPVLTYTVRSTGTGVSAGDAAERLSRLGYDVVDRDGADISVVAPASWASGLDADRDTEVVAASPYPVGGAAVDAPANQDDILPRRLHGESYPTFYGGYRTVEGYSAFLDDLAAAYPELVRTVDYGQSWTGANPLRAVCVTAAAPDGCALTPATGKPRFLIVAQTHARELTTSELTWRYLTHLVDGYGRRADVTAALDGAEIWVVPQVNPDGVQTVERGITEDGFGGNSAAWQRKNLNDSNSPSACSGQWQSSQEGTDLNRNFAIDWGRVGTSTRPCDLTYGGPRAASEPETTGLTDLMKELYTDRRGEGDDPAPLTTSGAMLTLHSYANQVLLPWGFTTSPAPNEVGLRSFAFRMSYFNGYETGQAGEILYDSSGATEDWLYDRLGVAGFTWEVGPGGGSCGGFFPAYSCQDDLWAQNREALRYTASAAAAPYELTLGPTTVSARSKLADSGLVQVRATADDDAYGARGVDRPSAQNVVAGRLYVGAPPALGGDPIEMTVRGSGSRVGLRAAVQGTGERQLGYVQARDGSGHWGPLTAVWIRAAS